MWELDSSFASSPSRANPSESPFRAQEKQIRFLGKPAALSKPPEQAFCIYSPKCVAELRSSPWLPAICREKSS